MTVRERWRDFTVAGVNSTYIHEYKITDVASDSAAVTELLAAAPATKTINGIVLDSMEPRFKEIEKGIGSGNRDYDCTVTYRHSSRSPHRDIPATEGDEKVSFQFSMPTPSFTLAIAQDKFGTDAKDVKLSLNVLSDGTVEGAEIDVPSDGFQVRNKVDLGSTASAINTSIDDLIALLGKKNDATFRGKEAGDVLFRSFSGEQRIDGLFDMVYDFAVLLGKDYTGVQYDTGRVLFTIGRRVPGFDYIWEMYEREVVSNVVVPKAIGVYVAKVFEDADLTETGVSA